MRICWVTDDNRSSLSIVEYGTSPEKYMASAMGDRATYHKSEYKSDVRWRWTPAMDVVDVNLFDILLFMDIVDVHVFFDLICVL